MTTKTLQLAACLATLGCASQAVESPSSSNKVFLRVAPSVTLVDLTGKAWKADDPRHRAVLVEFWATTCGPCHEMKPQLQALYEKYKPKGLVMISVNTDGSREAAKSYLKRHSFANPVVLDDGAAWRSWNVSKLPTLFLLRDGKVLRKWEGAVSAQEISNALHSRL